MIERWADRNKRATFRPAELRGALAGPHCLREVIEAAKFRREEDIRLVASAIHIRPLLLHRCVITRLKGRLGEEDLGSSARWHGQEGQQIRPHECHGRRGF